MINNSSLKLIINKLKQEKLLIPFLELTFNIKITDKTVFYYKNNCFYFYNYPNIIIFKFTDQVLSKYKIKKKIDDKITIYNISIPKCIDKKTNLSKFAITINNSNKKEVEQLLNSYLPLDITTLILTL